MMLPSDCGDFLQHRLQTLLEFAAILRARDQRAEVEPHDPPVAEALGHVAAHDPLCEAFHDRRLADARLADEDRVVLRAPAENLDDPAHLLVPPDDGVEVALAGRLGQVAAVLLERLVGRLGILTGHALRTSDLGERLQRRCGRHARGCQDPGRRRVAGLERREEQVLGGNILVAHPLRDRVRIGQDTTRLVR